MEVYKQKKNVLNESVSFFLKKKKSPSFKKRGIRHKYRPTVYL